jgi:hypothetical protein
MNTWRHDQKEEEKEQIVDEEIKQQALPIDGNRLPRSKAIILLVVGKIDNDPLGMRSC